MPGLISSVNERFFPYTVLLDIIQCNITDIALLVSAVKNSDIGCETKIPTKIILLLMCYWISHRPGLFRWLKGLCIVMSEALYKFTKWFSAVVGNHALYLIDP